MDTSTFTEALPVATDALGRKSGPRRYRSVEEKIRIVEEAEQLGTSVAEVARRHDLNANLLFGWRRQYRQGVLGRRARASAKLLPVRVMAPQPSVPLSTGVIEIELPNEVRLRVKGEICKEQLALVLAAVADHR